jgi:hypothetical protein
MKQRFILAAQRNENPHVISDSIQVVPILSELCEAILALKERVITPELLSFISNRLKLLRNIASNVSMIPSLEEEIKGIDKKKFKSRFSRFAEDLQAIFIEV